MGSHRANASWRLATSIIDALPDVQLCTGRSQTGAFAPPRREAEGLLEGPWIPWGPRYRCFSQGTKRSASDQMGSDQILWGMADVLSDAAHDAVEVLAAFGADRQHRALLYGSPQLIDRPVCRRHLKSEAVSLLCEGRVLRGRCPGTARQTTGSAQKRARDLQTPSRCRR